MSEIETIEAYNPREALRKLEKAKAAGKVFHGSKDPNLKVLDPLKARDHSEKHGEHLQVVYAAPDDFLLPLVHCLVNSIDEGIPRKLRISDSGGTPRIWSETNNIRFDTEGWVYILNPKNFRPGNHDYEVYADSAVEPEEIIRVTPEVIGLLVEQGAVTCDISLK